MPASLVVETEIILEGGEANVWLSAGSSGPPCSMALVQALGQTAPRACSGAVCFVTRMTLIVLHDVIQRYGGKVT